MLTSSILELLRGKMLELLKALDSKLLKIRPDGMPAIAFFESLLIEAYGTKVSLFKLASVSIADNKTVKIEVWDKNLTGNVRLALAKSSLNFNPILESGYIIIRFTSLSYESRLKLIKLVCGYGEEFKISLRGIRRDMINKVKTLSSDISKDDHYNIINDINKTTVYYVDEVDKKIDIKKSSIINV